jgi:hypothetical protein
MMKKHLFKPLTTLAAILLCCIHSVANADFAAVYTQNSISMGVPIMNSMINDRIADNAKRSYEEKWGEDSGGSSKVKKSWTPAKTSFTADPVLTEKLQNKYIGSIENPKAKKVMSLLLTEKTAQRVYKDFHPEVKLSFHDMADTFTVAALSAFMTIEDRQNVTTAQVTGVREKFRSMFANNRLKKAEVQNTTQQMMYWLLLKVYSESNAEKDPKALASVKADASDMMASIGINPSKFTLGSKGFEAK